MTTTLTLQSVVAREIEISGRCAIARNAVSVPTRHLVVNEYMDGDVVLHFGSGKAYHDTEEIIYGCGCEVFDYDHNHRASPRWTDWEAIKQMRFDAVVCNYVLNVLSPRARRFTLEQLVSVDAAEWYITVRSQRAQITGTMEQDGLRNQRGTFQRTYSADQLSVALQFYWEDVRIIHDQGECLMAWCRFRREGNS